jgi:uncharacterized repeat protein (TIGR02543 family)
MPQYSFYNESSYPYIAKTSLTSLKLPAGLTSIGYSALQSCSNLSGNLTLPADLTSIGERAFSGCSNLSGSLTLPAGLISIGESAFYNCRGLNGSLTLPTGLTIIGYGAFSGCSGFASVTNLNLTPQNISGNGVFSGVSIEDITLTVPTSSAPLYENAEVWRDFNSISGGGVLLSVKANNNALGSVSGTLSGLHPANTTVSVAAAPASGYALLGWTSGEASLGANTTLSFTLTQDTIITANFGKVAAYNLAAAGTLKSISGIETVSHLTLTGHIDARDVKLMRDAMPVLTELDLSGATVMAYEGEEGTVPEAYAYPANEMPMASFYNISGNTAKMSLISVKLPTGLAAIGAGAFYSCSGLSGNMDLPAGLTSIGERAFYNCSSLSGSLNLPTGLTSIGSGAFSNCSNLSGSLTLPTGLTSIGSSAFYNCSGLSGSLTLPAGLTSIGYATFENCSGLSGSLTLPVGLTSIGESAFYNCSGLNGSLTLPAGLTYIGYAAFSGCSDLTSVTNLSLTPQNISGNSVFSGVSIENITLTVPTSSATRYANADVWRDFKNISSGGVLLSVKANNSTLGSVSGTLSGLHPANTTVSVAATPASSYALLSWTSGEVNLGTTSPLSFTLTQDTIITANFGKIGSYNLSAAGTLKDISGIETVSHLTLTGVIDARDVKFMRDAMPALTELDLSGAAVVAYSGEEGTYPWDDDAPAYPADEMPRYSFYNGSAAKTSLISMKLPTSLTSIGDDAFEDCSGLSSLTLPAGLTSIGSYALYSCSGLTTITNLNPVPQSIYYNVFYNVNISNVELRVPIASLADYQSAQVWSGFYNTIGGATLRVAVNNSAWGAAAGAANGWQPANATVTLAATPAQGYEFDSWTSGSASLGANLSLSFTLTQDTVITANFKPSGGGAVYTVTFVANGGSNVDPLTVASGDRVTRPANPTRSGYTFAGWYSNDELTSAWDFETGTVTANTTLYAKWAEVTYTVTFEVNNGSLVTAQTVAQGDKITKPADPTRNGYTFAGWYSNTALTVAWNFETGTVAANITLYAKWTPVTYTVTFNVNDGSNVSPQQVTAGSTLTEPANPTRSGYVFAGWYKDVALTEIWNFASDVVTANATLHAKWIDENATIYTVTFDANSGSTVSSQTVEAGGKVAPVASSRDGYTLVGWYSDAALTSLWNFATDAVTGNMTLYAKWSSDQPSTDVESHTLGVVKVYPNPTSGMVTVESNGAEVRLYSLSGTLLKRTSGNSLDLSAYPAGVYVLKAGSKTARIVKQ